MAVIGLSKTFTDDANRQNTFLKVFRVDINYATQLGEIVVGTWASEAAYNTGNAAYNKKTLRVMPFNSNVAQNDGDGNLHLEIMCFDKVTTNGNIDLEKVYGEIDNYFLRVGTVSVDYTDATNVTDD